MARCGRSVLARTGSGSPGQLSAGWQGDAYESLGQLPEALADYSQALVLDSGHASVLASRAVVYYALEERALALADLNEAIRLSLQEALFYQNRATALVSLDRPAEAAQNLQTYLHLQPDAGDRVEVEAQLAQLQAPIFPQKPALAQLGARERC